MLATLALGWPLLLIRAVFGLAMGIVALVSPPWSTFGFVFIIAAYASGDGALSLMLAVTAYDQRGSGALVFEGSSGSALVCSRWGCRAQRRFGRSWQEATRSIRAGSSVPTRCSSASRC